MVERLDALGLLLRDIPAGPFLTAEQELALGRRARGEEVRVPPPGDPRPTPEQAVGRLVEQNLRLVFSVARRYRGQGVPLEDLVQEGAIGLRRAAERFDPDRGFRFSTSAVWWIRRAITRAIVDDGRVVRLPGHAAERVAEVRRCQDALAATLGRAPTAAEVGAELGLTDQEVADALANAADVVSLDALAFDESDTALAERIADPAAGPEEVAAEAQMRQTIGGALGALGPRDRQVIELRYGIGRARAESVDEVARRLGVTRERVRQLETHALRQLYHSRAFREALEGLRPR